MFNDIVVEFNIEYLIYFKMFFVLRNLFIYSIDFYIIMLFFVILVSLFCFCNLF